MEYTREMKWALLEVAEEHLDECGSCGAYHTRAFQGDCRDDGNRTTPEDLLNQWLAAPDMYKTLEEIAEGKGRYSMDKLTHASNTIDDMRALAEAMIKKAVGGDF